MKKIDRSRNLSQSFEHRQVAEIICHLKDEILFEAGPNQYLPSDEEINIIVKNLGSVKDSSNSWEESVFEILKAASNDNSLFVNANIKEFARNAISHLRRSTQYCHIWAH